MNERLIAFGNSLLAAPGRPKAQCRTFPRCGSMVVVNTENFSGLLPAMTPATVHSQLAARGLRLNFDGRGDHSVSGTTAQPTACQ